MRRLILLLSWAVVATAGSAWGQEIAIVYTGETHAMIYPCNCPREPDGGIGRRATLLKQLRRTHKNLLLLDAGGFFAGGIMDEYTQNTQLDMLRTSINLQAMALMGYDAAALGPDEFNFGREFLEENARGLAFPLLACNVLPAAPAGLIRPYLVKEVAGIKVGIIGVISPSVAAKSGGMSFAEPVAAVREAVRQVKGEEAQLVILVGQFNESEDARIIREVPGIDICISGSNRVKAEAVERLGQTILVRPYWQGRRLNTLVATLKENRIAEFKTEEERLSDELAADPAVQAILPRCFSDGQCRQNGLLGTCQNPGSLGAECAFSKPVPVEVTVIVPRSCIGCTVSRVTDQLKGLFAGAVISYLDYPGKKAQQLMDRLQITSLPAYLLEKGAKEEKGFEAIRQHVEERQGYYLLKSSFAGMSYLPTRPKIKGKLDLFISLFDKDSASILENIKDFNPQVHFLVTEEKDGQLSASRGKPEVEECLRAVCVRRHYPQRFLSYITCRSKAIDSSWWEDCLEGEPAGPVKECARGDEGWQLLKENIILNRELSVMFGPTYLLDNQDIFSSHGAPKKEEYKKIFERK